MSGVKKSRRSMHLARLKHIKNCNRTNNTVKRTFRYDDNTCTYELLMKTVKFLQQQISIKPLVGIICGTGLGSIAECLTEKTEISYDAIPNFPRCTVDGHAGRLIFGRLSGTPTVCMQGRFHHYEGYPLWKCVIPIRVMKMMGIKYIILSNAAGALNTKFRVGDIVMAKDHINIMGFAGNNPLQGPNEERLGPRFLPMTRAYSKSLLEMARKVAEEMGVSDEVHEGVITCVGGPNFETIAEVKALKMLGADVVGMSVVHEVITARHCGLTVFAFSLITNIYNIDCDNDDETNHEEVMDVGKKRQDVLKMFVERIVNRIGNLESKANENITK